MRRCSSARGSDIAEARRGPCCLGGTNHTDRIRHPSNKPNSSGEKRTYSGNRCSRGPWLRREAPPASPAPSLPPRLAAGLLARSLDGPRTYEGEKKTPRLRDRPNPTRQGYLSNTRRLSFRDGRTRLPPPHGGGVACALQSQRPGRTDGQLNGG
jgi:hypothetical protein